MRDGGKAIPHFVYFVITHLKACPNKVDIISRYDMIEPIRNMK